MDDVRIQLALEPLVRVELAAAVELVLQVAEDLLGGGVVCGSWTGGCRGVRARPSTIGAGTAIPCRCAGSAPRRRAGAPRAWRAGASAARDLELGDVGPELGERTGRVEVAFGQVMHVASLVAPVRVIAFPRVPGADGVSQSHAPHDPEHALGRHLPSELVDQAHAHLPVAAPVRRASPDLADQWPEIGPRQLRVRQVVEVRGSGQPRDPQELVEPVSPPREQSDDGASLASRDFCARRARSFSRYATFAFR